MENTITYKKGVSVVIVTFNGSKRIIPVLEHLANQKVSTNWEILIIDNNSTDRTSQIAQDYWNAGKQPTNLRIVREVKAGTMYARKRGINESKFRYILFCDDDNWLNPGYVKKAYRIISDDPQIAAVGGLGVMQYEAGFTPPDWFKPYERNYGTGAQGASDGDITFQKGCLYSAGAIIDKLWLEKLYDFGFTSSLKGRDGKTLLAGEDTELTFALKVIGGRLHYSSEMWFKHFMPRERINWKYLRKLWRSFGYSDFIISPYNEPTDSVEFKKLFKKEYRNLKRICRLSLQFLKNKPKEGSIYLLERERKIGELLAFINSFKKYKKNKNQVFELRKARKLNKTFYEES